MDRARGAGCGIVIAHQSRADLTAVSPEFQKRIEANANTKIIGSMEDPQDREYYAKILGTKTTHKETIQVQEDWFGSHATGMKSIREVEEFIVHPNHIASLERGEVFTLSRTVDQHHGFVRVPLAPEAPDKHKNEKTSRSLRNSSAALSVATLGTWIWMMVLRPQHQAVKGWDFVVKHRSLKALSTNPPQGITRSQLACRPNVPV